MLGIESPREPTTMTLEEMMRDLIATGVIPEPHDTPANAEPDNYLYFPMTTTYGIPMANPQPQGEPEGAELG